MEIIAIISAIVLILISIAMVLIIMMQESRQSGLSGVMTGGSSDSYLGKNKGRTLDAVLSRITKVLAVIFGVLILAADIAAVYLS